MGTLGRYGICEDVVVKLTGFECSYKYEYLVDNLTNESSSTVMYSFYSFKACGCQHTTVEKQPCHWNIIGDIIMIRAVCLHHGVLRMMALFPQLFR